MYAPASCWAVACRQSRTVRPTQGRWSRSHSSRCCSCCGCPWQLHPSTMQRQLTGTTALRLRLRTHHWRCPAVQRQTDQQQNHLRSLLQQQRQEQHEQRVRLPGRCLRGHTGLPRTRPPPAHPQLQWPHQGHWRTSRRGHTTLAQAAGRRLHSSVRSQRQRRWSGGRSQRCPCAQAKSAQQRQISPQLCS